MHCRRGERWHNGEQGSYSEREVKIKLRGWKWSSKNNKKHQKSMELINTHSKINKSKSKGNTVSCDQSTPQQTNKQSIVLLFFLAKFLCTHREPGTKAKHDVHVWLQCVRCGVLWLAQALTLIKDTRSRQSLLDQVSFKDFSWSREDSVCCSSTGSFTCRWYDVA